MHESSRTGIDFREDSQEPGSSRTVYEKEPFPAGRFGQTGDMKNQPRSGGRFSDCLGIVEAADDQANGRFPEHPSIAGAANEAGNRIPLLKKSLDEIPSDETCRARNQGRFPFRFSLHHTVPSM